MENCSINSSASRRCMPVSFYTETLDIWPGHFHESWSALTLLIASMVAVCVHAVAERKRLATMAIHLSSWVGVADEFRRIANSSTKPRDTKAMYSKLLQDMLDDRRINNFRTFTAFGAPGSAALFMLGFIMYGYEFGMILPGSEDCLALLLFYILCLVARFGPWMLTTSLVDKLGSAMSLVLIAKICRCTGSGIYYGYANTRMAFRLGIGLCTLNHKIQGPLNILVGFIECYKNIYFGSQILAVWVMPVMIIATEMFTALTCWFLFYIIQKWVEEGLARVLDARAASNETTGVQRMLAVLCDAQVTLCSDGRISAGTESLSCILMSSLAGKQASSKYKGLHFADLLPEYDKSRFLEFIFGTERSTAGTPGVENETGSSSNRSWKEKMLKPAASLRVHMLDSACVKFPVELFHVLTSAIDGSALHLLGIRDAEGHISAPPLADASSVVYSELGFEVMSQASSPMDSQPGRDSASYTQRVLVKRPEDGLTPRELQGKTAWKCGASSCKSVSQTLQPKWRKLPELQAISLSINPFSKGFAIKQSCFDFQSVEEAADGARLPLLCDWLGSDKERVSDWIFTQVNLFHAGASIEGNELKDVRFRMPGPKSTSDGMLASRIYMTVKGAGRDAEILEHDGTDSGQEPQESDGSNCDSNLDDINVKILLEGLSARNPSHKHGNAKSVRSGSSRSSRRSLPSIKESSHAR
eukprot:TRINITY_DN15996_c0_g1_i1.p1 TRINITY_DN15996_c0_g1~~TRINITY_DN15996_c0_g1_i1.p1  ORF type:complete len:701 (+),score=99.95 TRINITY_DN15996_c0_g1_i1:188-2290(+)